MVTTALRSTPRGRAGASVGYSPAWMRSVQSAYIASARSRPTTASRASMVAPRLPGLHAAVPGREVRVEVAEGLGNLPRGLVAQGVAAGAAVGVDHRADPLALALDVGRDAVPVGPRARELVRRRDLEQGEPVLRRVVLGRRHRVGGGDRGEIERVARLRPHLLGVDQPVAAHPHVVGGLRQIGEEVAPLVVRHHDPDEAGGQVARLRDHPDPGLGAVGAGDHPRDVVGVHRNRPAGRLGREDRGEREGDGNRTRDQHSARRQHTARHVQPPRCPEIRIRWPDGPRRVGHPRSCPPSCHPPRRRCNAAGRVQASGPRRRARIPGGSSRAAREAAGAAHRAGACAVERRGPLEG